MLGIYDRSINPGFRFPFEMLNRFGWRVGAAARAPTDDRAGHPYLRQRMPRSGAPTYSSADAMSSHPYQLGHALVGPEEAGEGNQGGGGDNNPAAVLFLVLTPEGSGDGEADDGQLTEFDPEVEAEEGAGD